MTTFIASSLKTALAGVAAVGLTLAAPAATAAITHFTFIGAPYQFDGHPMAEAQDYIARSVRPGTPMPLARKIVAKTGAYCAPSRRGEGVVDCTAETFQRVPGAFSDVVWTVRLVPAADGTVASAMVSRQGEPSPPRRMTPNHGVLVVAAAPRWPSQHSVTGRHAHDT